MTSTVLVTTGIGVQTGKIAAFDRVSVISITGLAAGFYSVAVTGLLTTADGKTALAPLATGTVSGAGAVSLTFDTDTAAMLVLMPANRITDGEALLTVYATVTSADACKCPLKVTPAAKAGLTTTATASAGATLAEAQALVDMHNLATAAHPFSAVDRYRYGGTAGASTEGDITALSRTALARATAALWRSDIGAEPTQAAASQVEMETGTEAGIRSVSPLRVAQAIAALATATGAVMTTGAQSVSGAKTFTDLLKITVVPTGITPATASLVVNPASASADALLAWLGVGDALRASIDEDGDAYFAGNVGIGTTAPTAKLHVGNSTENYTPILFMTGDANSNNGVISETSASFKLVPNSNPNAAYWAIAKESGALDIDFELKFPQVKIAPGSNTPTLQGNGVNNAASFRIQAQAELGGYILIGGPDATALPAYGGIALMPVAGGNVGIGTTAPTAKLHLPAATATANTASLKIDAGVVATTPVTGNIESDGTHLYWTDSGGTRRQLDN